MPPLYGHDLFWQEIIPANQSAAVVTGSNEFLLAANWKAQRSENHRLRIVNEVGTVLQAGVKAVPPLPNTEYFIGVKTPVNTTPNREFSDFKAQEVFQELNSLTAAVPEFACTVGCSPFSTANHLALSGELSGIGPWSNWVTQARHYAAQMAEVKQHHPLPVDDHHFSIMKLYQCQGIPPEVFGFLGAPKVKLNPLPSPFLTPATSVLGRDLKLRQRALRLLSSLLVTRHLGGALACIIQATKCESNRYSLCLVRRLMLANSLTCLGEARTALMEAVRARQELRRAICRKTPDHVQMRIMTSDVFTTNIMSDQT